MIDTKLYDMKQIAENDLQVRAINLLPYVPTTALWDKEHLLKEIEYKRFLSKKTYVKKILAITDNIANQTIKLYSLKKYNKMLASYIDDNSTKTGGFFIFEYDKNVDEQGYLDAKLMLGVTNSAYNIYLQKLDTPSFDKAVATLNKFLNKTLTTEDWTVYGCYATTVIDSIDRVSDVNKDMLKDFQEKMDSILIHEKNPSKDTIGDDLELK